LFNEKSPGKPRRAHIPVVGNLRTKIELHRYEPGHLPGLAKPFSPDMIGGSSEIEAETGARSRLQTWLVDDSNPERPEYHTAVWDFTRNEPVAVADPADHFSRDIDIDNHHLTGRRLRPNHVYYRADSTGVNAEVLRPTLFDLCRPGLIG
jgi:hypothetical protein